MTALYRIQADYLEVLRAIADPQSAEDFALEHQEAAKMLSDERDVKLDSVCEYSRKLNDESEALEKEITRLKVLLNKTKSRAERMKEYVAMCLGNKGWSSLTHKISFRDAVSVVPDSMNGYDGSVYPEQYARVKTASEPNKQLMMQDLKLGADIPGWKLLTTTHVKID